MFDIRKMEPPKLGLSGLEAGLSEEEKVLQATAHHFAVEKMRPCAAALDRMSAEEAVAPSSPLFPYLKDFAASGLLNLDALASMEPAQMARMLPLLFEELGYGDVGLTVLAIALSFPAFAARLSGNPALVERFGHLPGCWIVTQPERGSDVLDMLVREAVQGATRQDPANLSARIDGDHVILHGRSSEWISGGPIAQCALAYVPCDYGEGMTDENGYPRLIGILVPFDLDGVSRGKPHENHGQRSLPQCSIHFDQVRVPKEYVIAGAEECLLSLYSALAFASMEIACTLTGLARAAFDHMLKYVHERSQGGGLLIEHQSVRLRMFDVWRKLEACRAVSRRIVAYNYGENGPHPLASNTSKTFVTQAACEAAEAVVSLMGANGLSREYPVEKLLRDARAALVEDGENNILSIHGANYLSDWYRQQANQR